MEQLFTPKRVFEFQWEGTHCMKKEKLQQCVRDRSRNTLNMFPVLIELSLSGEADKL